MKYRNIDFLKGKKQISTVNCQNSFGLGFEDHQILPVSQFTLSL